MPKLDSPIRGLSGFIVVPESLSAREMNDWLKRTRNLPDSLKDVDGTFAAFYGRSVLVNFHLTEETIGKDAAIQTKPFTLTDKRLEELDYPSALAYWVNEAVSTLIEEATNTKN